MRTALTLSGFAAGAAVLSFLLVVPIALSPASSPPLGERFTPELVELHGMVDSTHQRTAHRVALVLIATFALAGMLLVRGDRLPRFGARARRIVRGLARRGGWIAVAPLAGLLLFTSNIRISFVVIALVLTELLSRAAPFLDSLGARRIVWSATVVYAALLLVPGLFLPVDLSSQSSWFLSSVEAHYSAVLGSAAPLASGEVSGGGTSLHYGALIPTLSAIGIRLFGEPELVTEVRALQAVQLLFVALAALAYSSWRPRSPISTLLPLLLIVPYVSNFSTIVWFPNQTAWRFIGFPVAALALLAARRSETNVRTAATLGGVSALLLVLNLETGIAASLGMAVYLAASVDDRRIRRFVGLGGAFGLGVAAGLGAFVGVFRLGLGYWPMEAIRALFVDMGHFSSGYAGSLLYYEPLAGLVFLHAAYALILAAMQWRTRRLGPDGRFRAAMATAILVWFAYYVNRPHPLNLWSLLFLYGFLLADLLDRRVLALRTTPPWWFAPTARTALVAFIVLPAAVQLNRQAFDEAWRAIVRFEETPPSEPESRRVSGVWFDAEAATVFEERAAWLRDHADDGPIVYFTASVYLLPRLSGVYSPVSVLDAFNATVTHADFERLVAETLALEPRRILFDAGSRVAGPELERQFFARLGTRLADRYRPVAETRGWQVWERSGAGASPDVVTPD